MERRGSTASGLFDPGIPDVTRGKVFPTLMLLMEGLYMFAVSSMSVYLVFGFGEFMVTYDELIVQSMTIKSRFYGCCVALLIGILCDSYVGHYYSVLTFLIINTLLPILHFVIAVYPHSFSMEIKLRIANAAAPFWGILLCAEPPRIRVISTAVFELSYFRKHRTFFALLVYVWYIGAFLGGFVVYVCGSSRTGYAIILGVDTLFMGLYIGFWIFSRSSLLSERGQIAVVERALAYTVCLFTRQLDRICLKTFFYKRKQGTNDFLCVQFSDRSAINSRSILGTLLIILPLAAYFTMLVLLETLYYTQISMLDIKTQLFPLITVKNGIYLILFPPMELFSSKVLDKWFQNSITKQLMLIGIGAFVISFSVMWTAVVQHEIAKDTDFWRYANWHAHVSFTNYFDTPVNIRGRYYNKILLKDMDSWSTLEPMRPLFILRIPEKHLPFHMEFENSNLSLYDEYNLSLPLGAATWFILFSGGLQQIHSSCHPSNIGQQAALNPNVFEPATVCVMCALAVCNGHLTLQGEEKKDHVEIPLGTQMQESKVLLSGKYQVVVRFGELAVSGDPVEVHFEKLGSYLLVVYERRLETSSKNKNQDTEIVTYERSSAVRVMNLFSSHKKSCWWMFPTIFLHAVGQVFAEASMLTCLYLVSPHDVRATVFSLASFLSLPAHWYLFMNGSLSLQGWKALYYFTLGCTNCLFMIIYFFSSVYYVHLFLHKRSTRPPARRSLNPVSSDMTLRMNEDKES